jgi:hypothetical protein
MVDARAGIWHGGFTRPLFHRMKRLLFLALLLPATAWQLHAQQAAAGSKRSTPAAATTKSATPTPKRSTSGSGKSSTPAPALDLPVEAKPTTPRPAAPSAPEGPRPRGNWEVYPADQMPAGKYVTEAEAAKMASGDYSEKKIYLTGNFYVAIAHKDRVILRSGEKGANVVASYPVSIPTPAEGIWLAREAPRGLRITRIKRPSEDEVTIYVREIVLP